LPHYTLTEKRVLEIQSDLAKRRETSSED